MNCFDIIKFKNFYFAYLELRKRSGAYNYSEWRTGGKYAKECKSILDDVKSQLELILTELGERGFEVYCCKGASYYPKRPWIAILFAGEQPTDGVYPVLDFTDGANGLIIGCVESVARPQYGFTEEYSCGEECLVQSNGYIDEHFSKHSVMLSASQVEKLTFEEFSGYLRNVLDECHSYRREHPRAKKWFEVERINDVKTWIQEMMDGGSEHRYVYRGQGDSSWGLESGLGRGLYDGGNVDVDRVVTFEQNSMLAFRREIATNPSYRDFEGVNLLAVMQHYGSKTRLLDFSLSPLVALYMALEQRYGYESNVKSYKRWHENACQNISGDIAVWVVDILPFIWIGKEKELLLDDKMKQEAQMYSRDIHWWKWMEFFQKDADAVLQMNVRQKIAAGIDVIFPNMNNTRISAQEGLFLMPRRIGESFESNMNMALIQARRHGKSAMVKKYIFPNATLPSVQEILDRLCISAKMIYPDLTGLAKSMNGAIFR